MAILDIILGIIFLFFHSVGALTIAYILPSGLLLTVLVNSKLQAFIVNLERATTGYWLF